MPPQIYASSSATYESNPGSLSSIENHSLRNFDFQSTTPNYPFYKPGRTENVVLEHIPSTSLPNVQRSQVQDFSPIYHSVKTAEEGLPRPVYREQTINEEQPIFLPIPQDKQEDYTYPTTVIEQIPEVSKLTLRMFLR